MFSIQYWNLGFFAVHHRTSQEWLYQFLKGDSNPNDKYVLSERALWTMNFYTNIVKIGWKMGK